MPVNKYALLRYRIIDRCLSKKNYPNKEDLRQACEDSLYGSQGINISPATIEKDLWAMRNESELGYYAPITYSKLEKGYFYSDDNYSINDISLNDSDLEAIQFAAQTLEQFKSNPLFQQYENAIDKIVNRLKISPNPVDRNLDKLIQFENTPTIKGSEYLSRLLDSIKANLVTKINYKKYNEEKAKSYTIHPYLLKEYRNRWYLIAFEPEREKYLTFGLGRIEYLKVLEEDFLKNSDFKVDRFFKHSVGITEINSNPQKVLLCLPEFQANYLESHPIHHSQKTVKRKDNKVWIELQVLETYELIQFILGFGKDVEVLEPIDLRKRIKNDLAKALNNYS